MRDRIESIAVVGLGMIGGSFATACSAACPETRLVGIDVSPHACNVAFEQGWVQETFDPEDEGLSSCLNEVDLVVLAVPVERCVPYFEVLAKGGFKGVVTDTGSTKERICSMADALLPDPSVFIPGHPMTGSEQNGIEGAKPDLFQGAHWILCPNPSTPPESYTALHDLLTQIGARVISLPREDHDAAVALVSHVPHIVASSLVRLASQHVGEQEALFRLAARGFKDSTRIAAGSPELWGGILLDNAEEVCVSLQELRGIIEDFRVAISTGDRMLLEELLGQAARARRAIPARWLPDTKQLFEARIPMENRAGAVAEITTEASARGCNIQSIHIHHITPDTAVLSLVLTDEGDMQGFADGLRVSGYAVSIAPLSAKE